MKRAAILTISLVLLCLFAMWLGRPRGVAPIDVVIDHEPVCAQAVTRIGVGILLTGVTRGACTTRNAIRN